MVERGKAGLHTGEERGVCLSACRHPPLLFFTSLKKLGDDDDKDVFAAIACLPPSVVCSHDRNGEEDGAKEDFQTSSLSLVFVGKVGESDTTENSGLFIHFSEI